MKTLLIATRNKGKMKEIRTLLTDLPIEVKSLEDLNITDEIEETGKSYEENAILKAKTIGNKSHLLTLGEDSGLEIDALDGWPGLHSARHTKGTDDDRIDKILEKMKGIPRGKRTARYKAVVALCIPSFRHPDPPSGGEGSRSQDDNQTGFFANVQNDNKYGKIVTFSGQAEGHITRKRIGRNGFGYDPIFWSKDLKKTFAQATDSEKNRVSHRARALGKFRKFIENNMV